MYSSDLNKENVFWVSIQTLLSTKIMFEVIRNNFGLKIKKKKLLEIALCL